MKRLAIVGATALAGTHLRPVADAVVVIENGLISAIGPASEVGVPEGAEIIDATGLVVAPGFIDAHVHIGFVTPRSVLLGGVTTVRDLAWPWELIYPVVEASRASNYDGPTVVAAGPMLTAPGGYPTRASWAPAGTGLELQGPDDGRAAVEELAKDGVAVIKVALNPPVGPTLNLETLRAVVDAAHSHGLKVTGHIYGISQLEKAISAGIDELAHMLMSPEALPDNLIERMVNGRITIVPTLSVFFGRSRRVAIDNLRRFIRAGGNVVYGTDLGNAGPSPGIDRREVKGMSKAGMSSEQIIAAATVVAAEHLGLSHAGVLAAGKDADVVALPEVALREPRSLTDVRMVFRRGIRAR